MITFTRSWRGYAAGTSVSTLADTIEAIAVAEGAATYGGIAGPLNSYLGRTNAVQAQVDAAGNGVISPTRRKIVCAVVGDSRPAKGVAPQTATVGGTVYNWYWRNPAGVFAWVPGLTFGRVQLPPELSVALSSTTSADIVNTQLPQLEAKSGLSSVSHLLIMTGANDLRNAVLTDTEIQNYLLATWKWAKDRGIIPVQMLNPPANIAYWSATAATRNQKLNAWIRSTAPALNVVVIDVVAKTADPASATGGILSSLFEDDVHPNILGGYVIGVSIADYFNGLVLPPRYYGYGQTDVYDSTNNPYGNWVPVGGLLLRAGSGTASGTGASGNVVDNFTGAQSSGAGSSVWSVVARSDGGLGNFQRQVLSGAAVTAFTRTSAMPSGVTAGELVSCAWDLVVAGATNLTLCQGRIRIYDGPNATGNTLADYRAFCTETYGSDLPHPSAYTIRQLIEPLAIPAGAVSYSLILNATTTTGGGATIDYGLPEIRKVA